jgi:CheY-like chemotaxis protein
MHKPIDIQDIFRRKILHCDHHAANIYLFEKIIDCRKDLQLLTATNGAQCVQMACDFLPSVILLETRLVDMDCIEFMRRLRGNNDTANIPVIAVSSNAMPSHIEATMNAGIYQYLSKPFKIQDLMQAIDSALGYSAQRREGAVD